jgi:hypothetical protein
MANALSRLSNNSKPIGVFDQTIDAHMFTLQHEWLHNVYEYLLKASARKIMGENKVGGTMSISHQYCCNDFKVFVRTYFYQIWMSIAPLSLTKVYISSMMALDILLTI